ncbi:hypothetical protein ACE4Z5_26460, partial [Salmonella enterica]|uniref:hypothetical protein n=1 Tax=Salmonella enterica TaxID=28901 RepID=UPI003D2B1BC3
ATTSLITAENCDFHRLKDGSLSGRRYIFLQILLQDVTNRASVDYGSAAAIPSRHGRRLSPARSTGGQFISGSVITGSQRPLRTWLR